MKLIIPLILAATPATAETLQCAEMGTMFGWLSHQFEEQPIMSGQTESGLIVTFWLNPETGTWTVVETVPDEDKTSCITNAGVAGAALPLGEPV